MYEHTLLYIIHNIYNNFFLSNLCDKVFLGILLKIPVNSYVLTEPKGRWEVSSGPLGLDFHQLFDVFNTMLLCHINDVVQGV